MSELVYRVYNKKQKKYCVAGLMTTTQKGKTWSTKGHARSALSCKMRGADDPRWDEYEIHEFELVRGMTVPAREEKSKTFEQSMGDVL